MRLPAHADGSRRIEPELLDVLPATDPGARRSRRDLRRVNWLMGNARILAGLIGRPPQSIVEIGAGDGTLMLEVARRLGRGGSGTRLLLLDRQELVAPATKEQFARLGWQADCLAGDVFAWLESARDLEVVACNLFLHHFSDQQLAQMFALLADRTTALMACEPRRFRFPRLAGELVWLIGCSAITRHDAVASIRAGFVGEELSAAWPARPGWHLLEQRAGLFSQAFSARRL